MNLRQSIIRGKHVTGHCLEYDYQDGTAFVESRGQFLNFNMGPPPYPLEFILRDATGAGRRLPWQFRPSDQRHRRLSVYHRPVDAGQHPDRSEDDRSARRQPAAAPLGLVKRISRRRAWPAAGSYMHG